MVQIPEKTRLWYGAVALRAPCVRSATLREVIKVHAFTLPKPVAIFAGRWIPWAGAGLEL